MTHRQHALDLLEEFAFAGERTAAAAAIADVLERGFVRADHFRRVFASLRDARALPSHADAKFARHFGSWLEVINQPYFKPIITSPHRLDRLIDVLERNEYVPLADRSVAIVDLGTGHPPYTTANLAERLPRAAVHGFDLYAPSSDFYRSNPALRPESSNSRELSLRSIGDGRLRWRLAAYENRIDDLIVFVAPTVVNVGRAEIRGIEGAVEVTAWVDAPPGRVWQEATDVAAMAEASPELQSSEWLDDRPQLGARFVGHNRHEALGEWSTMCYVVEWEEDRAFAWAVEDPEAPTATWRFTLEPADGGTRLTQWVRMGPAAKRRRDQKAA